VQQLDVLYDIMTDITGNLDRDTVLKAIVERTIALLRVTQGMIALYDPEQNNLRIHYSVGMNRDYAGMRIAPGEGVIGRVAQTRQPLVVYDYQQWGRAKRRCFRRCRRRMSWVFPLLSGDELIGTLSAGDVNLKTSIHRR
jgi:transcriptional regulator with GAF, ATPase, and Fis domain